MLGLLLVVQAIVSGQRLVLNDADVVKRLRSFEPGPLYAHVVEVAGRVLPVKEAFAHVTGLDLLDFNTNQARGVFKKLGFKVRRLAADGR